MGLPADYDEQLWFGSLTFSGIMGRAMAHGIYRELFRADGFPRSKVELMADPRVAKAMPDADEIARDAKFTAFLADRVK